MSYKIVDRISMAPSLTELDSKARHFGIDLEIVIRQEQGKWYAARSLSGETRKYIYYIAQNPALLTWQSVCGKSPVERIKPICVKKANIERYFPDAIDEGASAKGGMIW